MQIERPRPENNANLADAAFKGLNIGPAGQALRDAELHVQKCSFGGDEQLDVIRVEPHDLLAASNNPERVDHLYVNGAATDPADLPRDLEMVTAITGRAVETIQNPTQGRLRDLWNSFLGFFSPGLGRRHETEAVSSLMRALEFKLNGGIDDQGRKVEPREEVQVVTYSQGAVITSNALFLLRENVLNEDGEDRWKHMAARIRVINLGGGIHEWPAGIDVASYAHRGDVVSACSVAATKVLSFLESIGLQKPLFWLLGLRQLPDRQIVYPDIIWSEAGYGRHSLKSYVGDVGRFLVQPLWSEPELLAKDLACSIRDGDYPDGMFIKVLERIVHEHPHADRFARAFIAELEPCLSSPSAIGKFAVPEALRRKLNRLRVGVDSAGTSRYAANPQKSAA